MDTKDLINGKFVLGSASKQGDSRRLYEDRVYTGQITSAAGLELIVGIVADGVGSANGSIAANLSVDSVVDYIKSSNEKRVSDLIYKAISSANTAVVNRNNKNPEKPSMTTMVLAIIYKDKLYIGNAGDSRGYLVRNDSLRQLTNDHTYYNTYGGDPNSPKAEMVLNCVGRSEEISIDMGFYPQGNKTDPQAAFNAGLHGMPLKKGDTILLCSDGLIKTHPVTGLRYASDEEIIEAAKNEVKENSAAVKMVSYAEGREVDDNVSIVTIQYLTAEMVVQTLSGKKKLERQKKIKKGLLFSGLSLLGIVIAFLLFFVFRQIRQVAELRNMPTPDTIIITLTPEPSFTPEVSLFSGQIQVFQVVGESGATFIANGENATRKLINGMVLTRGTTITSSKDTGVRIGVGSGVGVNHLIYLFPDSQMELSLDEGFDIKIIYGSLYIQPGDGKGTVYINNIDSTFAVVEGSQMVVASMENELHIECYEGECTFFDGLDGYIIPISHYRIFDKLSNSMGPPKPMDYELMWERNLSCNNCLVNVVPTPTPRITDLPLSEPENDRHNKPANTTTPELTPTEEPPTEEPPTEEPPTEEPPTEEPPTEEPPTEEPPTEEPSTEEPTDDPEPPEQPGDNE